MAKTVFLNNHSDLVYGYEVNTTVVSAEWLLQPQSHYDENGNLIEDPPLIIGVKVYPASMSNIETNQLLNIGGVGDITVSGTGSDGGGGFFTYSPLQLPSPGATIRTPWNPSGVLRVTRDNNSVRLTYYMPVEHDLYFGTQKSSDSGLIAVTLDGSTVPGSPFDLTNPTTILASVFLKPDVSSGVHTVVVTAQIAPPDVFVYFHKFEMLEHVVETGGEYLYLGPAGTLEDSVNNFVGDWSTVAGFAFTTTGASVFFYPQLDTNGSIKIRVQKTPDSAIVALYKNGAFVQNIDLYADPGVNPFELTILANPGDPTGVYEIELRHTGTKNPSSTGFFFYFASSVVVFSRTDTQALELIAKYLKQTAAIRGDGAFLDAHDSNRINFDSNALYGCMGLLAAYQALGGQAYLDAVKNFLTWFASMQISAPGVKFEDGHWKIGYQVNPNPPPTYLPAIAPYDAQGISEIRWVDAVQCLPAFVLWWYWKLSGDTATKNALLPTVQKAIDGFIANNYDPETGFFYSSWQNKTAPTIFLYHDAIRRYSSGGSLLEEHNDSDQNFFTYAPVLNWASYAPQGAIGDDEHFTLASQSYVEFSLALNAGDQMRWVTQTAWDVGIAEILVSTDGTNFSAAGTVDGYSQALLLQQEFLIYTAPTAGTYWLRIRHSGTINPAGNVAPGWTRLASRFTAGQSDVALGLIALWLLTREMRYAQLAARLIRRFPGRFWSTSDARWYISLEGNPPGTGNPFWFPMTGGYTPFVQKQSRFFQPTSRFAKGLQAMEPYQDAEGGFKLPGYIEAEHIFSAFYLVGENQLAAKTNPAKYELAKDFVKAGQYFKTLGGELTGGITFSKRYQYLYTNIAGFAALALAEAVQAGAGKNPFTEQLKFSQTKVVKQR